MGMPYLSAHESLRIDHPTLPNEDFRLSEVGLCSLLRQCPVGMLSCLSKPGTQKQNRTASGHQ
jgi:hypothetical protein